MEKKQELNPTSPVAATGVANVLFFARRFDEAISSVTARLSWTPARSPRT